MKSAIVASTPGRLSLFGEHSYLIKEAVMIGLDNYRTYVKVEPNDLKGISVKSYNNSHEVKITDKSIVNGNHDWYNYIKAAIIFIEENFHRSVSDVVLTINSTLPIEAGLSSSAAFISSTLGALFEYYNIALTKQELAHFSYITEHTILNHPVGQMDMYGCVFGGVVYVDCHDCPVRLIESFQIPTDVCIIVGNTHISKRTKSVIGEVMSRVIKGDPLIEKHIKLQREIIAESREIMRKDKWDLTTLGYLINQSQESLRDNLQVSNENLNNLCKVALEAGSLGAKLTGAGKGGCMFALCLPPNKKHVAGALEKQGATVYSVTSPRRGIEIEKCDLNFQKSLQYTYAI